MAGGESSPTQPPPAKRPKEASTATATTIHSLGEDLLLAIFLRLPSLATLVRAALTCRGWRRAVASSPSFRRRFRELHPPPLLGLLQGAGFPQVPNIPTIPAFVPTRPRDRDRDLTAAVRGGDFFLTYLQDRGPDEALCWYVADCCRGYVLLVNWEDGLLVVFNPVTRRSEDTLNPCSVDTFDGSRGRCFQLEPRLFISDDDPTSFLVVFLTHDESRVRVTFFSSHTKKWSLLPWGTSPLVLGKMKSGLRMMSP
ncbi:hypothetical protein ACP4OV_027675 [Aristida adscensionis]